MPRKSIVIYLLVVVIIVVVLDNEANAMSSTEKQSLKLKVIEMFKHAYGSYMKHAYPADELMPLSCKGRYRGSEPSRGDVDDSLGNFTLTLVDTLDTLAILGDIPEFELAVRNVIRDTKFDADVVVSVFETNIRVLGGLLGSHVIATYLKRKKLAMEWYADELLNMAKDIGTRLLPAFNTTTGIPYPRVNLKRGIDPTLHMKQRDTCTACAGTMILEFAALSRLTGDPVFEEKAHKAMDYLWNQRHRSSDLMGTVINVQNGDWIRRESGVGAGIDSYYEYVLKAYILLGDDTYLDRFNKHYDAIMKYVSQGPLFVDVHMHRPHTTSRHFMDALLAFWPGLQVLKGDIQPAIELHEMLYQVMQRHKFLPEAFTSDFRVHWGQHPLRPEFVESTYFLYKATGDPYYLEVGKVVIDNLETHARVPCGFAALKDVTKGTHEDQLDSFVLAETFKYLFLLYAEKSDLVLDVDDYIFTTEAHLLPLSLSLCNSTRGPPQRLNREMYSHLREIDEAEIDMDIVTEDDDRNTCPNPLYKYKQSINYAQNLRLNLKDLVKTSYPETGAELPLCPSGSRQNRLRAQDFIAGNKQQLIQLKNMGIQLVTMNDGRIQLLHTASEALTAELAEDGLRFMQEMIELSKTQQQNAQNEPMLIQLLSPPYLGSVVYKAGPAQFGYDLKQKPAITGLLQILEPFKGCTELTNGDRISGKIAVMERGDCMFIDKARNIERAGAIGGIVIDHNPGTASDTQPLFAMSGDNNDDVHIPMLFLFHKEGHALIDAWKDHTGLQVMMTDKVMVFGSEDEATDKQKISQPEAGDKPPDTEKRQPHETETTQSEQTSESEEQKSAPYRKYEFKTIQPLIDIGQFNVKQGLKTAEMEIEIDSAQPHTPVATDNGIINLRTLPDGSKQLVFKLDSIQMTSSVTPGITEIYEELLKTLQTKTNFNQLEKKDEYLQVVVSLLEAAYYGAKFENEEVKALFTEFSNELELLPDETNSVEDDEHEEEQPDTVLHNLDQSDVDIHSEEEFAFSVDQTESMPQSEEYQEVTYSYPETPEVRIIHGDGVRAKIYTRTLQQGSESYANEQDFEEDINQFKRELSINGKSQSSSDRDKSSQNIESESVQNKQTDNLGSIGESISNQEPNILDTQDKKYLGDKQSTLASEQYETSTQSQINQELESQDEMSEDSRKRRHGDL